jgi:hypothetical protein
MLTREAVEMGWKMYVINKKKEKKFWKRKVCNKLIMLSNESILQF